MKVIVYVEGPADVSALQTLLKPLVDAGRKQGVGISFLALGGKAPILNDVPRRAAEHLRSNPNDWIVALPDLYPMKSYDGTNDAHRSFTDLTRLLRDRFDRRADKIGLGANLRRRFRVHCLKHDLEALLLAAPDALRQRLGTKDQWKGKWRLPVEEQNDDKPPKYVVDDLFKKYRRKPDKYIDTIDAPWILARASLDEVARGCSQRFAPFVKELRSFADKMDPDALEAKESGGAAGDEEA